MTADRVVALVVMVVGFAGVTAFNRKKLARMNPAERAQFDRNIAPFARSFKAFMWLWVVVVIVGAVDAAIHGVWPVAIAMLVLAMGLGWGFVYQSRWWSSR